MGSRYSETDSRAYGCVVHHRNQILDALETELPAQVTVPIDVQGVTALEPDDDPLLRIHLGDDTETDLLGATDGLARAQRIDFVYMEWGEDRRAMSVNAGLVDDQIWAVLEASTVLDPPLVQLARFAEYSELVFFEHDKWLLAATIGYDFVYVK